MAEEAAAAPDAAHETRERLMRIKRAAENPGTVAHRMTVVRQFQAFLGDRPATAELVLEFLTGNLESGKYVPSSMWSRRSHLEAYYTKETDPPLDFTKINPLLDVAFKALDRQAIAQHAKRVHACPAVRILGDGAE
jgi:hypothetical protein